jgi:uncharacterized protein (TIGR00369 family)
MEPAQFLEELPFADLLGIELTEMNDGHAEGEIEMREELSWSTDEMMAHSGVTFTLTEVTGAAALVSLHDPPVFTVDIDVKYINPGRGDLSAEAMVVRDGENVGITEVKTFDEHQTAVSTATIVFQIN